MPEMTPEAQLQQEANEQVERETGPNLPLELGLHLLNSHSCDTHAISNEIHTIRERAPNHCSLNDLTAMNQALPDILDSEKIMPSNDELRDHAYDWPTAFEGRIQDAAMDIDDDSSSNSSSRSRQSSADSHTAQVCLDCVDQEERPTQPQFDIDSVIGFVQSLAVARRGLQLNFAPQFAQNLSTNVHLTLPVIDDSNGKPRTKHKSLAKVPHIRLGRIVGAEGLSVYLFFPAQWNSDKPTSFPGKLNGRPHGILEQWTNEILIPSLAGILAADAGQHLPQSLYMAQLAAAARKHERQARNQQEFANQSLYYSIQGKHLEALWTEITRKCALPEYTLFARPRLLVSSKGAKMLYKDATLPGTWNPFKEELDFALDSRFYTRDQVWVDLGKETACPSWGPLSATTPESSGVYLWRRCCIESICQWIQQGQPERRAKITTYTPAMLYPSAEVTIEFNAASAQRKQGWIFTQHYNSVKELFDTGKIKPFQAAFLDKLCWDPGVRAMLEKRGGAVLATWAQLQRSYLHSKKRASQALEAAVLWSYSIREEHRISLAFLD